MASKINADEFVDREGENKPTLPKGVVLSGVTTITTAVVAENEVANSTGINAGIITSTHFKGNLTGDVNAGIVTVTSQSVIGSAVTISASGIDIGAGVITATSYAGSGANLTGIGATIMVWEYNPEIDSTGASNSTGIGITFNQRIKAGSGNITIRTGGFDGTVVENFGIGSSVTISNNELSLTPTSSLSNNVYTYVTLPSGVITNMAGDSYVGTAYSFKVPYKDYELWLGGTNNDGCLGQNTQGNKVSSPVQVPGNWTKNISIKMGSAVLAAKSDGTLWAWGENDQGQLGQNGGNNADRSSPVQIPGTTWDRATLGGSFALATKTDGTLWAWGGNDYGPLGQNESHDAGTAKYSSPVQIPGDWTGVGIFGSAYTSYAVKTNGELWAWGYGGDGGLAQNSEVSYSSPIQIPGTTWSTDNNKWGGEYYSVATVKTDGTLWTWGRNVYGLLGLNESSVRYSSPAQIPGTTWKYTTVAPEGYSSGGTKTDGTLWTWGRNEEGSLGLNNRTNYSSPVQVPGTTWNIVVAGNYNMLATKTDGTLWSWGYNANGSLGQNNITKYSSPVQVPGTWGYPLASNYGSFTGGLREI